MNDFTLRVMKSTALPSLSSARSEWLHRRSENLCSLGKPEQEWPKNVLHCGESKYIDVLRKMYITHSVLFLNQTAHSH